MIIWNYLNTEEYKSWCITGRHKYSKKTKKQNKNKKIIQKQNQFMWEKDM